jgi:uncharacterized protein DUF397
MYYTVLHAAPAIDGCVITPGWIDGVIRAQALSRGVVARHRKDLGRDMKLRRAATEDGTTLEWTKSSYSSNDGPECVEVAPAPTAVHVRDSKDPTRPGFAVSPIGRAAFAAYAANHTAPKRG